MLSNIKTKDWIKGLIVVLLFTVGSLYLYTKVNYKAQIVKGSTEERKMGKLKLNHFETKNGAKVIFVESTVLPMVDVKVLFDAGSSRDGIKSGLADLTAMLIDQGTQDSDADAIAEKFERFGAKFTTSANQDMASFHLRSLSDKTKLMPTVELMAKVLSESTFPQDAFDREQKNAQVSISYEEQLPAKVASYALLKNMYASHPYANRVHGTKETVSALTRQDMIDFHAQYYGPKNMTIAIVGDITSDRALEIADMLTRTLKPVEKAAPLPKVYDVASLTPSSTNATTPASPATTTTPVVAEVTTPEIVIPFQSEQTHVLVGMPLIAMNDPDFFPLLVGNHILVGSSMTSRLFSSIRENHGLVYNVHGSIIPLQVEGPYIIGLQTKTEQASQALDLLKKEIKQFIEAGPTAEELQKAKQNLQGRFPFSLATNSAICDNIASIAFYNRDLNYFEEYIGNIEKVTLESIKDAYNRRVLIDKMKIVRVGKEGA